MKVVHVSDCFLPRLGGIEIQLAELTRMEKAAGHEVEVITATPDRGDIGRDNRANSGIPVHRVVAPLPFELPVHPRMGHHLAALFRRLRPDVVHVHVGAISPFGWAGVRQAALQGIPTVVTVHSLWDPATCALYRLLDATVGWTRWPGVCTTVSEAAAAPIRRVVESRVPVHVVANGIATEQWRGSPSVAAGDRPEDVHVVAVGRLAPRKQPLTLLAILRTAQRTLAERGEDVRLRATIVGDGPARPLMERYLRRYAMADWVELTGRLDRRQVRTVLEDADIFLAPARRESFGLAALEARMTGVPVVACAESGVADFVVPEKEGLLGRARGGRGAAGRRCRAAVGPRGAQP
jgi:glycosyltransferase involved in cell wall biosynthesis